MDTPPRQQHQTPNSPKPRRKYTEEEKKQLLANLDLEVKDRIRQFEAYLAHSLEAFKLRHENEITRIPRAIRALTIAEFSDKYDGDVNKALQAITKARMEANRDSVELDGSSKKRKWQPSADNAQEVESPRATKTARVASPLKKKTVGARPRLVKTPGTRRRDAPMSPYSGPSTSTKPSPLKQASHLSPGKQPSRMPSSASFNPALPKTPAFPRRPRPNESIISTNGSPLTNPYEFASLGRPGALEVVLSIKVPTKDGRVLEIDPLMTSIGDLELLESVGDDAKSHAKEELQELIGLMAKLGKWRI